MTIIRTERRFFENDILAPGQLAEDIATLELYKGDGLTPGGVLQTAAGEGGGLVTFACATTANLANIATAIAVGQTLDGYVIQAGDLVLVKNQSTPSQNGVYSADTGLRASDFSLASDWTDGDLFYINNGTVNSGQFFEAVVPTPFVIDTNNLTFQGPAVKQELDAYKALLAGATGADQIGFTSANPSVFKTPAVSLMKDGLDRVAELRAATLTEVTDETVHGDTTAGAFLYKSSDNNNLYVRLADGSTHRLHPVTRTTGVIPGAAPDQRLESRVSSPDGGCIHIYYDTATTSWRMFMIPGDGSAKKEVGLGVSSLIDAGETYDIEAQDVDNVIGLGSNEYYSMISGDSDSLGANGLPIIQGLQLPDAGANPSRQIISGGGDEPVGGKKLNRRNYRVRGWVGNDRTAFRQVAMKGEQLLYTTDNSTYVAVSDSGDWSDSIVGTADNGGGLVRVEVADTTGLATDDFVYIYGANAEANGGRKITVIDVTHFDLQGSTWSADPAAGSVYRMAHITQTSAGTNFGTL